MQAIILEDEQFASNRLKRLLAELAPEIEVLNVFRNIKDTADYLLKAKNNLTLCL